MKTFHENKKSFNQKNYFVEYINNSLNENNYLVKYINNSLNQNNKFR